VTTLVPPIDAPDAQSTDRSRLHIGRYPVVLPSVGDARLHLALVTICIFVVGIGHLGFRLSVPQILAAAVAAAAIEVAITMRRTATIIWPASALQTASSTALLLRVEGTASHDLWAATGWYYFAGIAAVGVLTKHVVRTRRGHIFNPSNIALSVAFLAFGSKRIEPLDFWWGPLRGAMVLAYAVIIIGGLLICRRLKLLGMGLGFWMTLAIGVGVLAAADHSITARWSLTPIQGAHFWLVILSSPEILIFLFFMLTDPRTVPSGRVARIVFGALVAGLGSLLMAPWHTEFGVKVALLVSLAIACASRPLIERRLPSPGSHEDDPRRWLSAMLRFGRRRVIAVIAVVAWAAAVTLSGLPARAADQPPLPATGISEIDPSSLPVVTIDPRVAGVSAHLATPAGARELAATLAFNLEVEQEALRTRDASLLPGVDHGDRLRELQAAIDGTRPGDPIVAPTYVFHALHLIVVFPGGAQRGANAGLVATATEIDITYASNGTELGRAEHPVVLTFALRQAISDRWLNTAVLPPPD
jgi:Na+-translocating ferredoxin:NAD+ oxidoreductase RnfD subunit